LILRQVGLGKGFYLICFLAVPVSFNIIYDFRSECALAPLLFAGSGLMVLAVLDSQGVWKYAAISGLLFALGFGIKPAMFPYTFGMMGASSLVWLLFSPSWTTESANLH
jgi:hypothetical protein